MISLSTWATNATTDTHLYRKARHNAGKVLWVTLGSEFELRALAVGAHPDDVEIGCGATLALLKKRGHQVIILVLTSGEASGDAKIREKECRQSARILGADALRFGNLHDTRVTDGSESIQVVEDALNQTRSDILFSHSPRDQHQDHRNAGLATLSAGRNCKQILLYESPAAFREFCPQVFVDVSLTFPLKMKALRKFGERASKICLKGIKSHAKEKSPPDAYVLNAVEGLARYRGFQAGIAISEAFEVGRFLLEIGRSPKS